MDRNEDRDEFLRHLLRQEREIRAFIGSLLPDRHLRDDVFQEVALILWDRFAEYDRSRPFAAWARGVAANKILQQREKDARFPLAFPPETIQAVMAGFERTEDADTPRGEALRDCMKKLPDKWRRLLSLRYEEELPADEIARKLNSTADAIYQALSRVRDSLEECMRRQLA